MERVCSWCGKYLGERCRQCGSTHVRKLLDTAGANRLLKDLDVQLEVTAPLFCCGDCGRWYVQGHDGTTHGMCEACWINKELKGDRDARIASSLNRRVN